MSHFAVMVITDLEPTEAVLSEALQPYHEFESTGTDDQYVQDIDITAKARDEFETAKFYGAVKRPNGEIVNPYGEDGNYKEEFRPFYDGSERKFTPPEGFEEVDVPAKSIQTLQEWASDHYGLEIIEGDDKPDLKEAHKSGWVRVKDGIVVDVIDRTNPNAKWDWWVVGGRYGGRLEPGYDPEKDPANLKTCSLCHGTGMRTDAVAQAHRLTDPSYTCNGCNGTGRELKWPTDWREVGNQSRVGDLDLAALKATRVAERRAMVEEIREKATAIDLETLDAWRKSYLSANALWRELPEPRPRGREFAEWLEVQENGVCAAAYYSADSWHSIEADEGQTIAEWIKAAPALSAFAILKDGQWFEQGEMGWWACVSNENPNWSKDLQKLLAELRPDQWITIVDCHI